MPVSRSAKNCFFVSALKLNADVCHNTHNKYICMYVEFLKFIKYYTNANKWCNNSRLIFYKTACVLSYDAQKSTIK